MMVMALGALSIVGLYAFGYRESSQSREDVEATALADQVIGPLVMAITHTNQSWQAFEREFSFPEGGWAAYLDGNGEVSSDPDGMAQDVFAKAMTELGASSLTPGIQASFPSAGRALSCGLVVQHERGSALVRIGFRATARPSTLLSMPLFYTEARFQGDPNR